MKRLVLFLILSIVIVSDKGFAINFDPGKLLSPGDLSSAHSRYEGIKNCFKCHAIDQGLVDTNCLKCHTEIQKRITDKKGFHGKIVQQQCFKCHTEHKGLEFYIMPIKEKFDHKKLDFDLPGVHEKLSCNRCHFQNRTDVETGQKTNSFTYLDYTSHECLSCHADYHEPKAEVDNKWASCEKCHTFSNFRDLKKNPQFDHDKDTAFKLEGAHKDVTCFKCHDNGRWKPIASNSCLTCHADVHRKAFGDDCLKCHTQDSFKVKVFDHNKTQFKLEGAHTKVSCESCHGDKSLTKKIEKFQSCRDCHADPHRGQFGDRDCIQCHSAKTFTKGTFDHNTTNFELIGAHNTTCERCHKSDNYQLQYKQCIDCHREIHQRGFRKNKEYAQSCDRCHSQYDWRDLSFDHDKDTDFKLEGSHKYLSCDECHKANEYIDDRRKCIDCHKDPHGGQFKDKSCNECHNVTKFPDFKFDHAVNTRFVLKGEHVWLRCERCHKVEEKYRMERLNCQECHKDIHKGNYGSRCSKCHNESGWKGVTFEHNFGEYTLAGDHMKLDCVECHKAGALLAGEGYECISCHKDPHFNSFGAFCGKCHNQRDWMPTNFTHNRTGFPLSGAHKFTSCESCHRNRIYMGLPNNCIFCHRADFAGSIEHKTDFVGKERCELCHFTTNWYPVRRR